MMIKYGNRRVLSSVVLLLVCASAPATADYIYELVASDLHHGIGFPAGAPVAPAINEDGRIVFFAFQDADAGGVLNDCGYFMADETTLAVTPVPTLEPLSSIMADGCGFRTPDINDGGIMAMVAGSTTSSRGIYVSDGSDTCIVSDTSWFYGTGPTINNNDQVAYLALDGIWGLHVDTLTPGSPCPAPPLSAPWVTEGTVIDATRTIRGGVRSFSASSHASGPDINDDGTVGFQANYLPDELGLFRCDAGPSCTALVDEHTPLSWLSIDYPTTLLDIEIDLDEEGRVAFAQRFLNETGNGTGIWITDGASHVLVDADYTDQLHWPSIMRSPGDPQLVGPSRLLGLVLYQAKSTRIRLAPPFISVEGTKIYEHSAGAGITIVGTDPTTGNPLAFAAQGLVIHGFERVSTNSKGQFAFTAGIGAPDGEGGFVNLNALIRATPVTGSSPAYPKFPVTDVFGNAIFGPTLVAGGGGVQNGNGTSSAQLWLDPPVTVGYDYAIVETDGPLFESAMVPGPLLNGDEDFTISFDNGAGGTHVAAITAGEAFDFTTIVPGGVDAFRIDDIDPAEALDLEDPGAFLTGTTFTADGTVNVSMAPIPEGGHQPAGSVPDGTDPLDSPLSVEKLPGGDLLLSWDASCRIGDDDYVVYSGTLGDFTSHEPLACSTAGAGQFTVTPDPQNRYYLVAPRSATREGSYGLDGAGVERPIGPSGCQMRQSEVCE